MTAARNSLSAVERLLWTLEIVYREGRHLQNGRVRSDMVTRLGMAPGSLPAELRLGRLQ